MRPLLAIVSLLVFAFAASANPVRDGIRAASVTVATLEDGQWAPRGSGTLFKSGKDHYCLTAAHLFGKGDKGRGKAKASQFVSDEDGKQTETSAEMDNVAFSEDDDLAIFKLGKHEFSKPAAKFYHGRTPGPDTEVLHCGSFAGWMHHSLVPGEITAVGRQWWKTGQVRDQAEISVLGGSSGGGLFLREDGHYIGMITNAGGSRAAFYIPARRILAWAEKAKVGDVFKPCECKAKPEPKAAMPPADPPKKKGCCCGDGCKCDHPDCGCGCRQGKGCVCHVYAHLPNAAECERRHKEIEDRCRLLESAMEIYGFSREDGYALWGGGWHGMCLLAEYREAKWESQVWNAAWWVQWPTGAGELKAEWAERLANLIGDENYAVGRLP